MLQVTELDQQQYYTVKNDAGLILIYTTSSAIAYFVDKHTPGLDPNFRLNVGGDPGVKKHRPQNPIFHHLRQSRR